MVAIPRRPRRWILVLVAAILLVVMTAGGVATFYTDLLWFQEVDKTSVFWGQISARVTLGLVTGIGTALIVGVNLYLAERFSRRYRLGVASADDPIEQYRAMITPYLRWLRLGVAAFIGLIMGLQSSALWDTFLLWRNRVPFGETDPQFGRDIGYYVFELPLQRAAFGWLFATLILTTLAVAVAHYMLGGIRPQDEHSRIAPSVITHLSVLVGLIVLLKAWAYRLDQFELLFSPNGTVLGASYTDVNARLPALQFLVGAAVLAAGLFFYNARQRGYMLPLAGVLVLGLVSILVGGAYPAFVQRFQVAPQELQREEPYIQRNIDATQRAYGLQGIEAQPYDPGGELEDSDVDANATAIESIRLWEPEVLQTGVQNLQAIGQYYSFVDMDVDRYPIEDGGETVTQQVMLGAREVNPANLQASARTWQNLHLAYTHGYGVVAAQVSSISREGRPSFLNTGFDQEEAPIPVEQPRIYFGELSPGAPSYVIANSRLMEVGQPTETGAGAQDFRYDGSGGIPVSNPLRRLAFALRFQDFNIMLSGNITPDSRLMFDREISSRIEKAAPFLEWDGDPYVAVVDGRVMFIRDGFTTTDMYPYSERVQLEAAARVGGQGGGITGRANYIRNSVKAVVDAFDGTLKFYVWDDDDPLLRTWSRAFPDMFTPRDEIPDSLKEHFRYPQDLFAVQTDRFRSYHIPDAPEYYARDDYWDLTEDRSGPIQTSEAAQTLVAGGGERAKPYYLLSQLPGADATEFVMVTPYTPNNRANMVSYMAARPVPPDDGSPQIMLLNLPRGSQWSGAAQVNAQFLADAEIARDVTFFNQQGSQISMGNLLTVPVEDSFMYVQPMFVQARGNAIPELRRVAVFFNGQLGYAENLRAAIDEVLEGEGTELTPEEEAAEGEQPTEEAPAEEPPAEEEEAPAEAPDAGDEPAPPAGDATYDQLVTDASEALEDAEAALQEGDLGTFQEQVERAGELLQQAQQLSSTAPDSQPEEETP